jgi:cytochrome c553
MRATHAVGIAAFALLLWGGPPIAVAQSAAPDSHYDSFSTIWNGVYSPDEAERGKKTAARLCENCHGTDLKGTDKAPRLTGKEFFDQWNDLRLSDVVAYIQSAMPRTHAFYVGPDDTRDIIGYMLRESGVPAGRLPISKDMNVLNQIFVIRPGGSR